ECPVAQGTECFVEEPGILEHVILLHDLYSVQVSRRSTVISTMSCIDDDEGDLIHSDVVGQRLHASIIPCDRHSQDIVSREKGISSHYVFESTVRTIGVVRIGFRDVCTWKPYCGGPCRHAVQEDLHGFHSGIIKGISTDG